MKPVVRIDWLVRFARVITRAGMIAWPLVANAQVTTFDPATNLVAIPSVSVGSATYTGVTLRHQGSFVFTLQAFTPQVPAAPGIATYDVATGRLFIPAVKVGSETYIDVALQNSGNFTFQLQAAQVLPPGLHSEAQALINARALAFATDPPAANWQALHDGCWRHDGYVDALAEAERQLAGPLVAGGVQVTAVRLSINADGSTRREIDVEYYQASLDPDGPLSRRKETLISGSSAGSPGCAAPQSSSTMRLLGNQQWVGTGLNWRTTRAAGYSITTGLPLGPPVAWRRDVQFPIVSTLPRVNYVIVTGPGISRKLVSPQILANSPELAGKRGNYINLTNDHPFLMCRGPAGAVASAEAADCTGEGAGGYDHGLSVLTPNAAADASVDALGMRSGGVYRFDVYDDDGWKTINGQATRTPLASYYQELPGPSMDYQRAATQLSELRPETLTPQQVHANALLASPAPVRMTWSAFTDPTLAKTFTAYQRSSVQQGPVRGNVGGAAWPAVRSIVHERSKSSPVRADSWVTLPILSNQANKSYVDYTLRFVDPTTGNEVLSVFVLQ